MYFKDLSQYMYGQSQVRDPMITLNVGWLSKEKGYTKGIVSDEFLTKLKSFERVNLCRGFHKCEFCDPSDAARGNGEIRVPGMHVMYAAPAMISHYVEAHYYKPPDEFIRAVLNT